MTIGTLRPDGWPQATTVGFASDGLTLYFLCGPDSQKAANFARDDRVSLTIDHDPDQIMKIAGLSMAAHARAVADAAEAEKALRLLIGRYSQQSSFPLPMPKPEDVRTACRAPPARVRHLRLHAAAPRRSRGRVRTEAP